MSPRRFLVALLLRAYPQEWRREYGDELADILTSRPLSVRIAADVLAGGLRQRARSPHPATILGVLSLLVVLSQFVLAPASWPAVVRPSGITFPTLRVSFLASEIYIYVALICGYWTERRFKCSLPRAGVAAMRMTLIAGSPVMLAGLLIALGVLDPSFAEWRAGGFVPSPIAMMLAPIAAAPQFYFWGIFGAWAKRRF